MSQGIQNAERNSTLMNGAAYWIFMNYEAIRLTPLFHLKLILTGTHSPGHNRICYDTEGQL